MPEFKIVITKESTPDLGIYLAEKIKGANIETKCGVERLAQLREALARRALGVFQWLIARTPRILRWVQAGEEPSYISSRIYDQSDDLRDVYKDIVPKESEASELCHACRIFRGVTLLQFAKPAEDLRYAICLEDMPKYSSMVEIANVSESHWSSSDRSFKDRIKRVSLGLVHVKAMTTYIAGVGTTNVEEAAVF